MINLSRMINHKLQAANNCRSTVSRAEDKKDATDENCEIDSLTGDLAEIN